MALEIRWNKRAEKSFEKILLYIETRFGQHTTKTFIKRTFTIIEVLSEFPELGTIENKEKNIRGILISKHNRLFYRISKDELILLNFFDTRQNPKRRNTGFEE